MILNIFKKGVTQLNTGIETWVVSWWKRSGPYSTDESKCYQGFTDKDEAYAFAESIHRANKLIGNTYHASATVTKQINGVIE